MLFQIKGRFSGLVQAEVEITCAPNASEGTKLGKAVLKAISEHANLSGANLGGANLGGADLSGANLGGAVSKVIKLVSTIQRSDGYTFFGFVKEDNSLGIVAGCQNRTLDSYRTHVKSTYPSRTNGAALITETTDILDFMEKRHAAMEKKL
jgi:uncharacterized protein YjbI with pentapeptide repeats